MTEKEFEKYSGRNTKGFEYVDLNGGIVVGYASWNNPSCLVIRTENGVWSQSRCNIIIPDEKERKLYSSGNGKYSWGKIKNVIMHEDMVDLTEILKGCEGIELWSDICGVCKLDKINKDGLIRVVVCETESIGLNFLPDGRFYDFEGAKCLLWPSETNRDWSTFKRLVKVRDDDFVVGCNQPGSGFIDNYGEIDSGWRYIIRLEDWRPDLTEEELEKLSVK